MEIFQRKWVLGRLVERILIEIQARTTIRHSGIWVVHIGMHPLFGILTHLVRRLSISSHLRLTGVRHSISSLLGMIKTSFQGDITKVLGTARSISAPRLRPTSLIIFSPLGGSNGKDITCPNDRLLIGYVRNVWPHIKGLLVLLLRGISKVCGWIKRNIIAPHLLDIGQRLYQS